jgi:hypothetical protein
MALIKKRDVESYFAERKRKGTLLFRSASQPDATGFSGKETGATSVESERPVRDELTTPPDGGVKVPAAEVAPGPTDLVGQVASRSAQL